MNVEDVNFQKYSTSQQRYVNYKIIFTDSYSLFRLHKDYPPGKLMLVSHMFERLLHI